MIQFLEDTIDVVEAVVEVIGGVIIVVKAIEKLTSEEF